jgi:hypothetical protein
MEGNHMIEEGELFDYMKQQNIKCGFGWYGLIMSILEKLRKFNCKHQNEQIKIISFMEKHGALSIATTGKSSDSFKNIFDKAIKASTGICEYCGCIGKSGKHDDGKVKTLCHECGMKYKKGKRFKNPSASLFELMKKQNIRCGYGWYGLIFPIIAKLKKHNVKRSGEKPDEISYFREKWGMLEISHLGIPFYLEKLIHNAQQTSDSICVFCGCPGNRQKDSTGWYLTLCPDCLKIHEEANNKQRLEIIEEERLDDRKKYIEEKMPEFLSELSALTQKYEIKISKGDRCHRCPRVSDMDNRSIEYQKLEYNCSKGSYTLEGFVTEQEENCR